MGPGTFWEGLGTPLLGCSSPLPCLSLAVGGPGARAQVGSVAGAPRDGAVVLGRTLSLLLMS